MKRYFIDTNIFLDTLIRRDEKRFLKCCRFLKAVKFNKIKAVTGNVVLAELIWTLRSFYGVDKNQIVKGVQGIIQLRGLKLIDSYNPAMAIKLYQALPVKYIDALIASIDKIQENKWIVVSYDKDFDKLNIKRIEPRELL